MLNRMRTLVCSNNICVLATALDNRPHCSLMAYVADDDCREIFMVTRKYSQKYRNLESNRSVSLLIDTRGEGPRDSTQALTISGTFVPIADPSGRKTAVARLVEAHPHLISLLSQPDTEILRIKVESFLLLDGIEKAYYQTI